MNTIQRTDHESSIYGEVLYTSYKWNLRQWSLLSEHYKKGLVSPEFNLSGCAECQCKLIFNPIGDTKRRQYESNALVQFSGKIDYCAMQLTLSFVDISMNKLKTFKSLYQGPTEKSISLNVNENLTDSTVAKYLQNDTLILYFEVNIVTRIRETPITTSADLILNHIQNTREGIIDLYRSNDLCDVVFGFKNTEKTLKAHKVILAAKSRVFRAMFTYDLKEKTESVVNVNDIDVDLFQIFLNSMYTGKVTKIENIVEELFAVANKYEALELMDICTAYMTAHLNAGNAINYLLTGHRHSCTTLENMAIQYIKSNTCILANANDFTFFAEFPYLAKKIFGADERKKGKVTVNPKKISPERYSEDDDSESD